MFRLFNEVDMTRHSFIVFSLLLSTACLTPKAVDTNDPDNVDAGSATVYDVQTGAVPEGEVVTLTDVIVTSGINARGEGFYVQDPGGGEYSGVYVYTALAGEGIAPLVGNSVSVTGVVVEYYGFTEISVSSPQSVVTTGEGTVTPTVVSEVSDWEAYEGVLLTLEQQEVVSDLNDYGECQLSFGAQWTMNFMIFRQSLGLPMIP